MSVRAYRINKYELEKHPSFNCRHDEAFFDFLLNGDPYNGLNLDGIGFFEVPTERLMEALEDKELNLNSDLRDRIKADIKWADDNREDQVRYDCA